MAVEVESVALTAQRKSRVGWLELFYDLIFVGAVTAGADDLDLNTPFIGFAFLLVGGICGFGIWLSTAMIFNRLEGEDDGESSFTRARLRLARLLVVACQMVGLIVGTSALREGVGYDDTAGLRAYAVIQATMIVLIFVCERISGRKLHNGVAPQALFVTAGAVALIASLTSLTPRIAFAVAVPIQLCGVALLISRRCGLIDLEHAKARFGALTLIMAGESFLDIALGLQETADTPAPALFAVALLLPLAVFGMYFGMASPIRETQPPAVLWAIAQFAFLFSLAACGHGLANRALTPDVLDDPRALPAFAVALVCLMLSAAALSVLGRSNRNAIAVNLEPERFTRPDGTEKVSTSRLAGLLTDPISWSPGLSMQDPHVYHLALSTKGGSDRDLSDAEWAEVAADMMDRIGIAKRDDPNGCRWVAVRHGKSSEGNDHIHVVAVLARQDGTKPRIWGDYQALRDGAQHWERTLGLTMTADADRTARKSAGMGEQRREERLGIKTPIREQLARKVAWAAAHSSNEEEFFDYLHRQGLDVSKRMSTINDGEVTGYSVGVSGHSDRDGKPVRYSGSKLDGHSLPKLRAQWAATPAVDAADPETIEQAATAFRIAAGVVSHDPDDTKVAGVAAAAGDSLAAWAAAEERAKGGPITELSQQVARAGRPTGPTVESIASTGLRQAGRALYMARRHASSEQEREIIAMLAAAMLLADSLAQWRAGQGKIAQVAAAVAATGIAERRIQDIGGGPASVGSSSGPQQPPPSQATGGIGPIIPPPTSPTQKPKGPRQ